MYIAGVLVLVIGSLLSLYFGLKDVNKEVLERNNPLKK